MPGILLSDVPKVSFYDPSSGKSPEDIPFPSCLAAVVHFLGRRFGEIPQPKGSPLNYAYTLVLAASGMAFGLRWKAGWVTPMVTAPRRIRLGSVRRSELRSSGASRSWRLA